MNRQEARGAAAREKICLATIRCLAELGYAETSILRVVERAQVSKGALQHHFPSKEDLMTATAERILANASFLPGGARRESGRVRERDVAAELIDTWRRLIDTDEYRALLEILVAIRTDKALQERLSPILQRWERQRMAQSATYYESEAGGDEMVRKLMTINNCLMRGLVIQEQYNGDPAVNLELMRTWVEILAPLLAPRAGSEAPDKGETAITPQSVAK